MAADIIDELGVTWIKPRLPAAVTFGTTEPDPEDEAAWKAANKADVEAMDPPVTDLAALEAELGVRMLSEISSAPPLPMIIDRLDPEGHTILYGSGGAGKGTIAAHWASACAAAGLRVLILDYENHPGEWSRRVLGLGGPDAQGLIAHVSPLTAAWSAQRGPLWDQATILRMLIAALEANVVIVDSIVMACSGADPMKPETAAAYAGGLELLGVPVLSLAHVTKTEDLRYPFGSAFWHNLARTTWSLKRDGERAILTHRKRNNYASLGRFVVTVTWRDDLPREVWEQGYTAALADRIADALGSDQLSIEQLVQRLNADVDEDAGEPVKVDSVRKALRRGIPERFTVQGDHYRVAS